MKRASHIMLGLVLVLVLGSCDPFGLFNPDYVGTWEAFNEETELKSVWKFEKTEFEYLLYANDVLFTGFSGDLAVENDMMTMTVTKTNVFGIWVTNENEDNETIICTYKVEGNKLTLTDEDGISTEFTKTK